MLMLKAVEAVFSVELQKLALEPILSVEPLEYSPAGIALNPVALLVFGVLAMEQIYNTGFGIPDDEIGVHPVFPAKAFAMFEALFEHLKLLLLLTKSVSCVHSASLGTCQPTGQIP